jgi:hypothetical protein
VLVNVAQPTKVDFLDDSEFPLSEITLGITFCVRWRMHGSLCDVSFVE